jgi:signal transduction histidine kinase
LSRAPSPGRRQKLLIAAFTAAVLAAVALLVVADLWWRRDRTIDAAEKRASNLAYVLAQYVRGSFAATDTALRQLALHARRAGGVLSPSAEWDSALAAARAALPDSGSITVTDASGIIRSSTIRAIVGASRRDEYVTQQLVTLGRDELVVSTPFLTVTTPRRYVIPLGRRLSKADGTFDGTVVATLLPDSYRNFFQTIDVGANGIIWVIHPSGALLVRQPAATTATGASTADNPILRAAAASAEGGVATGPIDGAGPFITAHRSVGSPPLIVAVSLDRHEMLADWRQQRRTAIVAFTALTAMLGFMLLALFRQIDARAAAEEGAKRRLETALEHEQRARREIEAASTMKDEFLMTVSHELRTPLTAIYGWVRMLEKEAMPAEQRLRALDAIDRNARAQTRLIDDLLDVSRAISGKLRLDARPCHLAGVAYAAAETLRPALEAKKIRLESHVDTTMDPIVADADRLQQVIWNLLSNAIKFTPDGGVVQLRIGRTNSHVDIVVSDTGIGIEPEFLPHVFERFRQAETGSRRRYTGLGLGLAIARHLVELHGGTIAVESGGAGQGTTFRVKLPVSVAKADARIDRAVAPAVRTEAGTPRLDGVRVLVVDDEPDARELFASILQGAGATVWTAASAADAIRQLVAREIDVLLSDIEMPGEDGYQLLQHAYAERSDLIAVAVTGYARAVDRQRALQAGFDAHLAKPVEPSELVGLVASLVAVAR